MKIKKIKLGIDIVYIPRFEKLMENKAFINKVFHASETRDYSPEHLAGVFAAKEAFFKAIKNPNPVWMKIEVKSKKTGPMLIISPDLEDKMQIKDAELSISHDKDYAIAAVILNKND